MKLTIIAAVITAIIFSGAALAGEAEKAPPPVKEKPAKQESDTQNIEKRIETLIKDLGADDYKLREAATKELTKIGKKALPMLEKAEKSDDIEIRWRATRIIKDIKAADDKSEKTDKRKTTERPNRPPAGIVRKRAVGRMSVIIGSSVGGTATKREFAQDSTFGISMSTLSEALKTHLKLTGGLLVEQVDKDRPAHAIGLKRLDIIIELEGKEIKDFAGFRKSYNELKEDTEAHITVIREGERKTLTFTKTGDQFGETRIPAADKPKTRPLDDKKAGPNRPKKKRREKSF
jgi:C-terminal processing protease CtpA/Prc